MQFDIHKNDNPDSRDRFPYLLEVQADLLSELATRVVVPLAPKSAYSDNQMGGLTPVLGIKGKNYVAVTPLLASIPIRNLGARVTNAGEARTEIVAALDLLITGTLPRAIN